MKLEQWAGYHDFMKLADNPHTCRKDTIDDVATDRLTIQLV